MKKIVKWVAIVVGVLFAIGLIRVMLMSPEERKRLRDKQAARSAAATASQKKLVQKAIKLLKGINKAMPAAKGLQEKACPEGDKQKIYALDAAYLAGLASGSPLEGDAAKRWDFVRYTGFGKLAKVLKQGDDPAAWKGWALGSAKAYLEQMEDGQIGVYLPVNKRWPILSADQKRYAPGFYAGWLVIFSGKDGKRLCQVPLSARNSSKVKRVGVRVVGIKLGRSAKGTIEKDFKSNFTSQARAALKRISPAAHLVFPLW